MLISLSLVTTAFEPDYLCHSDSSRKHLNMWVVVKIMVPFGSLLYYGTEYLGDPKEDHNFDNHPCILGKAQTFVQNPWQ